MSKTRMTKILVGNSYEEKTIIKRKDGENWKHIYTHMGMGREGSVHLMLTVGEVYRVEQWRKDKLISVLKFRVHCPEDHCSGKEDCCSPTNPDKKICQCMVEEEADEMRDELNNYLEDRHDTRPWS